MVDFITQNGLILHKIFKIFVVINQKLCDVCGQKLVCHSMSTQQGILGHLSDFDETYYVCSTYGAHHPDPCASWAAQHTCFSGICEDISFPIPLQMKKR